MNYKANELTKSLKRDEKLFLMAKLLNAEPLIDNTKSVISNRRCWMKNNGKGNLQPYI